ncbi:MAG: inverse autotransporter beta domain-containing protein, partial [Gammaproteobacteria bacterium]
DYEDGDYGDFLRYGIGGELSNSVFALAANYYAPQTDDRKINATVAAFSREGYDAKLRLNAPGYREVKAAFDYYHFDGKGETAKDAGWRYGLEFVPIPSFHFALYYDDGAETIGGDIGYSHTIGERQKRESNAAFSPDLFAAVSREYSQRIATVAIASDDIVRITPPVTTIMTMETERIVPSRVASVHFTARYNFAFDVFGTRAQAWILVTSIYKHLITLPDIATSPLVVSITGSLDRRAGNDFYVIARQNNGHEYRTNSSFDYGAPRHGHAPFMRHTLTITPGSEEFISVTTTLTTRTTTTMAAVTTTPPPANTSIVIMTMRTTTTMTTETAGMVVPSRVASVEVTVDSGLDIILTTFGRSRNLVTLPPASTPRPHVLTITTNQNSAHTDTRVIDNGGSPVFNVGDSPAFPRLGLRTWIITIVEGGEEIVGQPTTTTLTTRTTTTMTTFSTMFITLTANAAMGGNDEKNTPPNFPQKRAAFFVSLKTARAFFPSG